MPGPLDRILARADDAADTDGITRGQLATHVADLARTTLTLPDDAGVTVQQLSCREPDCPPIETVIAVLSASPRRWTLHHPLTAISDEMVIRLLTENPNGDLHDNNA